jgi:hypothetical protein
LVALSRNELFISLDNGKTIKAISKTEFMGEEYSLQGIAVSPADAKEIIVTNGGMGALSLLFLVLLNEGDEVLIQDPQWLNYAAQVSYCGGTPVRVPTDAAHGFEMQPETIEARINDMTELLEKKFRDGGGKVLFTELLPEEPDRYDITLSFMSLLSLIKNQNYDAEQSENFGEIKVIQREKTAPVTDAAGDWDTDIES